MLNAVTGHGAVFGQAPGLLMDVDVVVFTGSGAAALAARRFAQGQVDDVIVLGGTMGTDLALDLCRALPLGVLKYIVAFSPLIPAGRLAPTPR